MSILRLVACWLLFVLQAIPALAQDRPTDRRIALVIGNSEYSRARLSNPENDARLIAGNLRKLGFEVNEQLNIGVLQFRRVLREFARQVQKDDATAVLYYAGHGMQIDGRNYLLPVDINLRDQEEVKDESVDIDELFLSRIDKVGSHPRIVILDACRDNPFTKKTRNINSAGGLAEMGARGTLIAFASAPGAPAEDGPDGSNSIYTRSLAQEIMVPGIEVEQMFKNVRVKVLRDTAGRQLPWVNTSLTSDFSFNPSAGRAAAAQAASRPAAVQRPEVAPAPAPAALPAAAPREQAAKDKDIETFLARTQRDAASAPPQQAVQQEAPLSAAAAATIAPPPAPAPATPAPAQAQAQAQAQATVAPLTPARPPLPATLPAATPPTAAASEATRPATPPSPPTTVAAAKPSAPSAPASAAPLPQARGFLGQDELQQLLADKKLTLRDVGAKTFYSLDLRNGGRVYFYSVGTNQTSISVVGRWELKSDGSFCAKFNATLSGRPTDATKAEDGCWLFFREGEKLMWVSASSPDARAQAEVVSIK
ncbi:caspase family protein [Variovorax rhizosphaerae]|uniref:Caspase family protein n=1 Tax=Variovorax rhizosphaerae TaxID=1836200 RepID=A0ABU8WKI4_9BURK